MWVRTSGLSQPGQGLNFDSEGQSSDPQIVTSHLAGLLAPNDQDSEGFLTGW